jgi:hypothetical protein
LEQLEAFGKFWNFSIFSLFFLWPFFAVQFYFHYFIIVSKFCLLHVFFVVGYVLSLVFVSWYGPVCLIVLNIQLLVILVLYGIWIELMIEFNGDTR